MKQCISERNHGKNGENDPMELQNCNLEGQMLNAVSLVVHQINSCFIFYSE